MTKTLMRSTQGCFLIATAFVLSGCEAPTGELQQWMAEQRRAIKPHVKPLKEPQPFYPTAYEPGGTFDPFDEQKLTSVLLRAQDSNPLILAEGRRVKQPLEGYPLDTITMVGSVRKGGQLMALIKADNLLYQVKPGMYMGQNYGLVKQVSETAVTLREIVQDAAGEWIERTTTMDLQEN